ncbi:hypothetical protein NPIL_60621 [Nephila pilipes]|uniref:HTH CENPB-type domain-containing protein n=1 Tax=Nephila pilipes TaxID=299642 RepID=A0A8X6P6M0_NEPPI|nr:hypothetical protein NPIL_60621 [Nephila pilipes]
MIYLNEEFSTRPEFVASKSWFEKFKNHFAIPSIRIQEESLSADLEAARTYPRKIQYIIEDQGYIVDQVFNADETGLYIEKK